MVETDGLCKTPKYTRYALADSEYIVLLFSVRQSFHCALVSGQWVCHLGAKYIGISRCGEEHICGAQPVCWGCLPAIANKTQLFGVSSRVPKFM
jgi:hypothetical protein